MWANTKFTLQIYKSQTPAPDGFYPVIDLPAVLAYIEQHAPIFNKEVLSDYLLAFKESRSLTVNEQTIMKELTSQNSEAYTALGPDGHSGDYCSWLDHEAHLMFLSDRYPDYLFSLKAFWSVGNEQGVWNKHFLAGALVKLPVLVNN